MYPADAPASSWLTHYARRFDTVEVNSTFYKLPTPAAVRRWAASVPDGFVFASKLGAFATHRRKLIDPDSWLPRHLERTALFADHRGPCLAQLPGRWSRNTDRLEAFLRLLPRDERWALEVRDRSWLADEVIELLGRHGVALCVHDLLPDHPRTLTTDWTYLRFHGPDALHQPYSGAYGSERLEPIAEWIRSLLVAGNDVYAYFNNDVDAASVRDAATLRTLLHLTSPDTPDTSA